MIDNFSECPLCESQMVYDNKQSRLCLGCGWSTTSKQNIGLKEFKLEELISKENKILIGPVRLTRFEKARITGARSLQLSLGAPTLCKIPSEMTDTIIIAKYELDKKALPISIRRILPNGIYQDIPIEWTIK